MGRILACRVDEVAENTIRKVALDGRDIAIVNLQGKYYAFDDTCTHAGASLSEGRIDGCRVVCGWHAAEFDCTTGRLEKFPAKIRDLQAYNVVTESDNLFVEV